MNGKNKMEKIKNWCFLGASRGLGYQSTLVWDQKIKEATFYLVSRKSDDLQGLKTGIKNNQAIVLEADFNNFSDQKKIIQKLLSLDNLGVLYFAGGGPYGEFENQKWTSHQWAFEVNFLFPSKLLHELLKTPGCSLFAYVGSAVAENSCDPKASSYAASKHAMKGLLSSIYKENPQRQCQIRLLSPSYMDTDMLPQGSWPRREGRVSPPREVAQTLYEWLSVNKGDFHKVID